MNDPIIISELDAARAEWLDREAKRSGETGARIAVRLIRRGIEVEQSGQPPALHHDLDTLAGTWSAEEPAEFLRAVDDFNQIDSALWP